MFFAKTNYLGGWSMPCILLMLLLSFPARAQITHAVAIEKIVYGNVFSPSEPKDRVKSPYIINNPVLAYLLGKGRHTATGTALVFGRSYLAKSLAKPGNLYNYHNISFNLSYGYDLISHKNYVFSPNIGINMGRYDHTFIWAVPFPDEYLLNGGDEWTIGFSAGINGQASVWKGIFVNGNLRYTRNPFAEYERHAQTLYGSLGLGYSFGK